MNAPYDYVIVGSGFFGSTFARLMTDQGKRCLIIESRDHIGGNAYTKKVDDIDVHVYGPHIFHTNDSDIWQFVNRFAQFNNYLHCPKAQRNGRLYSLPFNMNTFNQIWGTHFPAEAEKILAAQRIDKEPANLEEQALRLVGREIYDLLIRDYTAKQWQRHPRELPAFIIRRLPLRMTYDDRYFDDRYQGIPEDGYTRLFENMLDGIEVRLNTDYFDDRQHWHDLGRHLVYTGCIDRYFDYEHGRLDYRTLEFQTQVLDRENYQGTAVINSCDAYTEHTRTIEHRHFKRCSSARTVITKEIPRSWSDDAIPYYPINDPENTQKYRRYQDLAEALPDVIFGGRLAEYRYYDMHQVIGSAMKTVKSLS